MPHGVVFYVATTGSVEGTGTAEDPFGSIARGLSALSTGDTLCIRGGEYEESINTSWPANQALASGASWEQPVTIRAYPGERAVLRPSVGSNVLQLFKSDAAAGPYLQYVVVNGLVLDAIHLDDDAVYIAGGPHHIRIEHCEVTNAHKNGVAVAYGNVRAVPGWKERLAEGPRKGGMLLKSPAHKGGMLLKNFVSRGP